ncbi:kinase-like domain-containing protein [Lactarius akahatsu]|uniref:Kinase-like domain-containing protein n=1 Tax=Lactarius akahatsu TaxID=416441 RepID=A0AAD4LDN5_9AGAM|nr:kinase-like domain-containing protein [Lactarius akahatsu]
MPPPSTGFLGNPSGGLGEIGGPELWWAARQETLERAGYMLRSRYRPGWRPSWVTTGKHYFNSEDGQIQSLRLCMDATRISDGRPVMLKRLLSKEGPYELQINKLFSTGPLSSDPRNHCARLIDVIQLPNEDPIMVHPLLRPFDEPPLQTYGEFVTFFTQICEGVQFMHSNNVAHRDCTWRNIMLDPTHMYPDSFHPVALGRSRDFRHKAKGYSRTRRPTRYLLIDFGLSRRYDPANGPPLDEPLHGGDRSAPEHRDEETPRNPFPTDVYYLGNLVRQHYMQKCKGFEFIESLITDMVQEDPEKRPNMDEVVSRFSDIKSKLSTWKLRSRIARQHEVWPVAAWRSVGHWYRTVGYVVGRKAAIPEPSPEPS